MSKFKSVALILGSLILGVPLHGSYAASNGLTVVKSADTIKELVFTLKPNATQQEINGALLAMWLSVHGMYTNSRVLFDYLNDNNNLSQIISQTDREYKDGELREYMRIALPGIESVQRLLRTSVIPDPEKPEASIPLTVVSGDKRNTLNFSVNNANLMKVKFAGLGDTPLAYIRSDKKVKMYLFVDPGLYKGSIDTTKTRLQKIGFDITKSLRPMEDPYADTRQNSIIEVALTSPYWDEAKKNRWMARLNKGEQYGLGKSEADTTMILCVGDPTIVGQRLCRLLNEALTDSMEDTKGFIVKAPAKLTLTKDAAKVFFGTDQIGDDRVNPAWSNAVEVRVMGAPAKPAETRQRYTMHNIIRILRRVRDLQERFRGELDALRAEPWAEDNQKALSELEKLYGDRNKQQIFELLKLLLNAKLDIRETEAYPKSEDAKTVTLVVVHKPEGQKDLIVAAVPLTGDKVDPLGLIRQCYMEVGDIKQTEMVKDLSQRPKREEEYEVLPTRTLKLGVRLDNKGQKYLHDAGRIGEWATNFLKNPDETDSGKLLGLLKNGYELNFYSDSRELSSFLNAMHPTRLEIKPTELSRVKPTAPVVAQNTDVKPVTPPASIRIEPPKSPALSPAAEATPATAATGPDSRIRRTDTPATLQTQVKAGTEAATQVAAGAIVAPDKVITGETERRQALSSSAPVSWPGEPKKLPTIAEESSLRRTNSWRSTMPAPSEQEPRLLTKSSTDEFITSLPGVGRQDALAGMSESAKVGQASVPQSSSIVSVKL